MQKPLEDKDWEKLEKLPAWQMTRVNSKSKVILQAQKEQRSVHFATLMDISSSDECGVGTEFSEVQRTCCIYEKAPQKELYLKIIRIALLGRGSIR